MALDFNELMKKRKEAHEILQNADDIIIRQTLEPLYQKKVELENKIEEVMGTIAAEKEELSQVEAELERICRESGIEDIVLGDRHFKWSEEITAVYDDPGTFFGWIYENLGNGSLDLLRADVISKRAITKAYDAGDLPPGIKIKTFRKFKDLKAK